MRVEPNVVTRAASDEERAPALDRWERSSVFHAPKPFGPRRATFPWHSAFSPDGKWVAFLDGADGGSLSVWNVDARAEAWRMPLDAGGFEVAFAEDSRRFATVARDAFIVVALGSDGWAIERRVPLGFDTATRVVLCPRPLCFAWWESKAFFAENEVGYAVSLEDGRVDRVSRATEKVLAYVQLPGRSVAEVLVEPFETRVRHDGRIERVIEGAVVCASPDGRTWLVAPNPRAYPWGRVELAIVDARDGRTLGRFTAGRKGGRRIPGWQFKKAAYSPDGSVLAAIVMVDMIAVMDARTGRGRQVFVEDFDIPGWPEGIAFSPDGRLLTASSPRGDDQRPSILLWERRR